MKTPGRVWLAAVAAFLPFPIAAALITWLRDLPGGFLWVLWIALVLLGLVSAGLVFWYLRRKAKANPRPQGLVKQVDEVFADANRRLRRSKRPRIRSTRALVLMGPTGSTKTTLIERSDLGAHLLVGEANREDEIIPTAVANVWAGQDSVIVEAGPRVLEDDGSWRRFVRRLRPRRWAPTLGRGQLPPRAAIVCLSISDFLTPDAHEHARQVAATLRERLVELASGLGIELPVYVVFTKVDRIPYFPDFAAVLENNEVQQAFGATLPFDLGVSSEAYGERQTGRVTAAFDRMFRSLARARLLLLPREADGPSRLGAYEFPRELNKVRDLTTQFLVDLCRPSQLSVAPQLRGFYFTGVRAVEISSPAAPAPTPMATPDAAYMEATRIFSPQELAAHVASAGAAEPRVVPQWVFVDRMLRDVVGGDLAAQTLTGSGLLVHAARRAILAAAMLALLVGGIGATVSFRRNTVLTSEAVAAVRGASGLPESVVGAPSADQLAVLDSLRRVVDRLSGFEVDGKPWSYRWGLYHGSRIRDVARQVYFDRFHRLLLADARTALVDGLGQLGPDGGGTIGRDGAYAALKAYLITAGYADRSTPEFLAPVLLDHWSSGRTASGPILDLVGTQFEFYARELPLEDPFTFIPYEPVVQSARAFIQSFSDQDRYYSALVEQASGQADGIGFGELYPAAARVVRNEARIPGAFTQDGWEFVHGQLENIDALLALEDWVIGGVPLPESERQALAADLRARVRVRVHRSMGPPSWPPAPSPAPAEWRGTPSAWSC